MKSHLFLAAAFAACPLMAESRVSAADAGMPLAGAALHQSTGMIPTAPATKDIQDELGRVVDAATSSSPLASVISNTCKADHDRMAGEPPVDSTDLTKVVEQFRKDWQAKYGQDFIAGDKASIIFSDQHVQIMQGNTSSAIKTATAHVFGQSVDSGTGKSLAATKAPDSMAMVILPGRRSSKSITLNLVNEGAGAGWKFKLISHATSQDLHDSLLKQVNAIEGMKDKWPSDVNEAYFAASRHFLVGLGDAGMQTGM